MSFEPAPDDDARCGTAVPASACSRRQQPVEAGPLSRALRQRIAAQRWPLHDEPAPFVQGTRRMLSTEIASLPAAARPSAAAQEMFAGLYNELRRLARSRLAGGGRHTLLDTSALVHEAFLRMRHSGGVELQDREHFMAYAATTMRSVVIDFVRRRSADRRGGGAEHVTLDAEAATARGASDDEVLAVHAALETLAKVDARLVRVVELRYFAGLTDAEIAAALDVTDRTVRRDWERARLLLAQLLGR
jgi:RNA polymerase sigma factor (TIGR02999 family)